ncbi:DUF1223 domain-containing protein [Corallincola luteus]|uniref:DUF1223 domain-containing protein n=1 Tax=Corallincola luteus TaxID=1775177 RepID=A0ABY2AH53_9GAMM|nr:DUF1223 domain-containing protein [Corallincola luteus]TCI01503.1 DUF1223 domain-containing protein [Corallincola luteus]
MKRVGITISLLAILLNTQMTGAAFAQEFKSGSMKGALLELYTSQGCSSCPPADAWLSTLKTHPALWKQLFPIALHVDYWNYLGWKDPHSTHGNSLRQRQYKAIGASNAVYTPGFILDGKEWRHWFVNGIRTNVPLTEHKAGRLSVTIENDNLIAHFEPVAKLGTPRQEEETTLTLTIAILGFDIQTQIPAGENKGKSVSQDFVLLNKASSYSNNGRWQTEIPTYSRVKGRQIALVAWIEAPKNPQPIQVTGGWLKSITPP